MTNELYMIQEGIIMVQAKKEMIPGIKNATPNELTFLTLPTLSYFGDYQILFDLKSQHQFRSGPKRNLLMCLKASKFKELMEDYPLANKFYCDRAFKRRIEFRRLCLKHLIKLKKNQGDDKDKS
jgi:hypothetical protein